MKNLNFHTHFRLNGIQFSSKNDLLAYSKTISSSVHSFLVNWFDDTAFVTVQTSGSTGKPKSIRLKKEHMTNSALVTGTYFELPAKTTALLCLSADYIAGKMMLVRALVLGWELDITTTDSHPLKGLSKTYDFSAMVPLQVYNSIDELYHVKKLIVGGGAVSIDLQKMIDAAETEVYATYGMTETITHVAVKKLTNFGHAVPNPRENSASHYDILPNIKISKDSRGCLVIDAPKISDETINTNDLVEMISETEFNWLGRYDTVINSGGIKLIPEQIERKLSEVIENRFFVTGMADAILGERLLLILEQDVTSSDSDAHQNCIEKISNLKSLSKFEVPKEIYFIEKFIETETKKINRTKTLEKLFAS